MKVINTVDIQNVDQNNICSSRINRVDTKTRIKSNYTYKLRNKCNIILITNIIRPLKIETEWNIFIWINDQIKGNRMKSYWGGSWRYYSHNNNKFTIKIVSQRSCFSLNNKNIINEIFLKKIAFLYTIYEIHEESMSLSNGWQNKMNRSKIVMKKSFFIRKQIAKRLHDKVVPISNTYTQIYILIRKPSKETFQ